MPVAPGLGDKLKVENWDLYTYSENPYSAWALNLANCDPEDHGKTTEKIVRDFKDFREPWAVVYHSMYPHWPYKFTGSGIDLPVGWPYEHPEIPPQEYAKAYAAGCEGFGEQVRDLYNELQPDVMVVSADHGEAFREHGQFLHPPQMHYPEQVHVPLFVFDGKRKYTDGGLLGMRHFPEIVLSAGKGKRVRARDEVVYIEDYHDVTDGPTQSLVIGDYLFTNGEVFDLSRDAMAQRPLPARQVPESVAKHDALVSAWPKLQYWLAEPFVESDTDDVIVTERMRRLGYIV
jgi:hypothetical protein